MRTGILRSPLKNDQDDIRKIIDDQTRNGIKFDNENKCQYQISHNSNG